MRSELVFQYDDSSFVASATCSLCGEKMQQPAGNVTLSADRVLWFAERFLEHKKNCHPAEIIDGLMGVIIAYDHISGKEIFRIERQKGNYESSVLPMVGDEVWNNGQRYKVRKRIEDHYHNVWKIAVSDESSKPD